MPTRLFHTLRLEGREHFALLFLLFMLATGAAAQEPARISFISLDRAAFAEVFLSGPDYDRMEFTNTGQGGFSREAWATLPTDFGSGSAQAVHRSEVTDMAISMNFAASWEADHGQSTLDVTGRSSLDCFFQVTAPVLANLSGIVELTGESGVQVVITNSGSNTEYFYDDADLNSGLLVINESFELVPGTYYSLAVQVSAGEPIFDAESHGEVMLDLFLDVGDTDLDGLPNVWESEGIDVDGDGTPEIDLPALGADPLHKDIFVEVDVQSGSSFPLFELSQVADSFAAAPVSNPDGLNGITLHNLVDEDNLPMLTYPDAAGERAAVVATQKAAYFGTTTERGHPEWPGALQEAKLRCFHYAVIGGDMGASGWGEIVGDDFILTMEYPGLSVYDKLAGYMHELGHNLGLRHGGDDHVNIKPNYYSIMNYMFAFESRMSAPLVWQLDYSRTALPTLNEAALVESDGFGGPAPYYDDKYTAFNEAAGSETPVVRKERLSESVSIDFDGSGGINAGTVAIDLNHLPTLDPSPNEVFFGHDDWANLSFGFTGSDNFGLGPSGGLTTSDIPGGEITPAQVMELTEMLGSNEVGVQENWPGSETRIRLAAPWPNPVTGLTQFAFVVPADVQVELSIFDLRGHRVATVLSGERAAGQHLITWQGQGDDGSPVASGQYLAALTVRGPDFTETVTRKVTVLR